MAYSGIDKVRAVLPDGVVINDSADKPPTKASVTETIGNLEAEVDNAFASVGVTVPITDATLVKKLDFYITRRAAYDIHQIRGVTLKEKEKPLWLDWKKDYEAMLKQILDGVLLPAADAAEADLPESHTMDAEEDTEDPSLDPKFTFGKRY